MFALVRFPLFARAFACLRGLIPLLCLGVCASTSARVIYVDKYAPGTTHTGATWTTAFVRVRDGINAATGGDEIWVAASARATAYLENLTMKGDVALYGGFSGIETARNEREWVKNITVLDGGGSHSPSVASSVEGAVLDGFAVRNAYQGISVSSGTAVIANCSISANSYGVMATGGRATVSNCTVSGNYYGVMANGSMVNVANCIICGNSSNGVFVQNGTANITNCTISANSWEGIFVYLGGTANVTNCTVSSNTRGISALNGAANITNCIVSANTTGIYRDNSSIAVTLSHNDVFGNTSANFTNITDPTGSNGNISQDPKLCNIYHDIHIQPGSPCIGAGDDSVVKTGWTDIDGQPRTQGMHVDIGSDESDGTTWTVPSLTWYVSASGNDANDGTSWGSSKRTVSGALAVAQGTDEVWVAEGVYLENVVIPAGVSLFGGFAGTETGRRDRNMKMNVTVLDGSGNTGADVVKVQFPGIVLDGFTVRSAGGYSAGVDVSSGGPAIVANCTINGNQNGIYAATYGTLDVTNCTISGNTYGVYVDDGTTNVVNCTISSNAHGVHVEHGAGNITNCVVAFNATGVYRDDTSIVTALSHNDVYRNTSADYVNIADPTGINGNIRQNPVLSNVYHDIHIQPRSPCIDAGDDSAAPAHGTDIDGEPRIQGAHVDIGSDESDGTVWTLPPRTWYVSPKGKDENDGTSWGNAKGTVRGALAVAQGTDEVWVAEGVYQEIVTLPAGVNAYGGFQGTETAKTQRDWRARVTVLDGSSNAYPGVVTSPFPGAVLDGFTVRNAGVGANGHDGVYVAGGTVTVTNCAISGNSSGIDVDDAGTATVSSCFISGNTNGVNVAHDGTATVSGCTVSNNTSRGIDAAANVTVIVMDCFISNNSNGGISTDGRVASISNCTMSGNGSNAITIGGGTATVSNCSINSNTSDGIYAHGNTASITNSAIYGNAARGVTIGGGTATITNCTIGSNASTGISIEGDTAVVSNCIVAFNGTGIGRDSSAIPVTLSHNDLYGNASANYAEIADPTGTNGNISQDPLLSNPDDGDFYLLIGSPCVDTGDDTAVAPGMTDLGGHPRIIGPHVDMGAYEFNPALFTVVDAVRALRISGGLTAAVSTDSRLNVEPGSPANNQITLADAIRIGRKAAGRDPNP